MIDRTLLTEALAAVLDDWNGDSDGTTPENWATVFQAARLLLDFPTNAQVEVAAQAGYEATNVFQSGMVPPWENATVYVQEQWRAWARAALEALRDTMIGDG